jgi:hypothetical protein
MPFQCHSLAEGEKGRRGWLGDESHNQVGKMERDIFEEIQGLSFYFRHIRSSTANMQGRKIA